MSDRTSPALVVVEGKNDVQFLKRISRMLHDDDAHVPDLSAMEGDHQLVFLPCGGDVESWAWRLAPLGCREFHLYDRDCLEEVDTRRSAVATINGRPGCRASITTKRTLENYLHPQAVLQARGVVVDFSDEDDVADVVARACYVQRSYVTPWEALPLRGRKRYRNHVKGWLNTRAVDCMTAGLLAERDPAGEVRLWLATIAELARG